MPEVTHDIMVRQVVDCSHDSKAWFCSSKYKWSQQDHLKVDSENHDVMVSFGFLFIILLFLS